jgi:hypothetical protein
VVVVGCSSGSSGSCGLCEEQREALPQPAEQPVLAHARPRAAVVRGAQHRVEDEEDLALRVVDVHVDQLGALQGYSSTFYKFREVFLMISLPFPLFTHARVPPPIFLFMAAAYSNS